MNHGQCEMLNEIKEMKYIMNFKMSKIQVVPPSVYILLNVTVGRDETDVQESCSKAQ